MMDASGIWTTFKFEYPKRATTQKSDPKASKSNRKMLLLNF